MGHPFMIPSHVDRIPAHSQRAVSLLLLLFPLSPQIPLLYLAVRILSHSDKDQLQHSCGKVAMRITLAISNPDIARQLEDVY